MSDRDFTYDCASRLTHVEDDDTDEYYSYDDFGNLENKCDVTYENDDNKEELLYWYFEDGSLKSQTCNGFT